MIDQVPLAVVGDIFPFQDLQLTEMVQEVRSAVKQQEPLFLHDDRMLWK
jgi:hypothetical protein